MEQLAPWEGSTYPLSFGISDKYEMSIFLTLPIIYKLLFSNMRRRMVKEEKKKKQGKKLIIVINKIGEITFTGII